MQVYCNRAHLPLTASLLASFSPNDKLAPAAEESPELWCRSDSPGDRTAEAAGVATSPQWTWLRHGAAAEEPPELWCRSDSPGDRTAEAEAGRVQPTKPKRLGAGRLDTAPVGVTAPPASDSMLLDCCATRRSDT